MKPLHVNYIQSNGDYAILIYFKQHPQQNQLIQFLAMYIRRQNIKGICEVVPAMQSLLVVFKKPLIFSSVIDEIHALITDACQHSLSQSHTTELHHIKVCYDEEVAPDLISVMAYCGVTKKRLIEIHTAKCYTLAMLGFLPGFAYLDGLDSRLTVPRKAQPEQNTQAGSIAIAGNQTGLYALNSPGGWHVIGRTPMPLIQWQLENPLIYKPLDKIRFEPISLPEFKELSA